MRTAFVAVPEYSEEGFFVFAASVCHTKGEVFMQIFNTLTRQKEEFVPQVPGEYRI